MDTKNVNILGLLGIIGAILMIVGVFLDWGAFSAYGLININISGWQIATDWSSIDYSYVPLVAFIAGIIALVAMIIPTFVNNEGFKKINNILGIVVLILALVSVILDLMFFSKYGDIGLAIGFWLVLVGGIITLVGGLMPLVKNRLA